jgi:hypothetical protein
VSISRPQPVSQDPSVPLVLSHPSTVPHEPRIGPVPLRPKRPDALDEETLSFMRDSNARMVLPLRQQPLRRSDSTSTFASVSTITGPEPASAPGLRPRPGAASTPSMATTLTATSRPNFQQYHHRPSTASIESRLGFPTGHSAPRSSSLEVPLAARVTPSPSFRLPVSINDSSNSNNSSGGDGSVHYSRFSEFVQYHALGGSPYEMYNDNATAAAAAQGPIEQFDQEKQCEWSLEEKVSRGQQGRDGGGMVFRDSQGGFHFVENI